MLVYRALFAFNAIIVLMAGFFLLTGLQYDDGGDSLSIWLPILFLVIAVLGGAWALRANGRNGLAVTLLAGSGLLLRSFAKVLDESPGFLSGGVLTASITLPASKYPDTAARARGFGRILEEVRRLPGVTSAGLVDTLPFSGDGGGASFDIEGRPETGSPPHGHLLAVDEDYFASMSIPLLRGRAFSRAEWDTAAKVAIIGVTLLWAVRSHRLCPQSSTACGPRVPLCPRWSSPPKARSVCRLIGS